MNYRLGNNKKIKEVGETVEITCPKCENKVTMFVYSNNELKLSAECPIVSSGKVFFLVCPHCCSVYGVNEAKGKVFKKGEKLAIGNYDLQELEHFGG